MPTGKLLIIVFVVIVAGLAGIFLYKNKSQEVSLSPSPSESEIAMPTVSPSGANSSNGTDADPLSGAIQATIVTARGSIKLALYPKVAPKTVANFVKLAKSGFYDGTKFHRVVADFVIQGGDPLSKTDDPRVGTGGPGYTFEDEINPKSLGVPDATIKQYEAAGYTYNYSLTSLPVVPGVIAMANSGPNTNGSQFFIVIANAPQLHLYGKHTVFGKVVSGGDVALKIKQGDVIKKITIDK